MPDILKKQRMCAAFVKEDKKKTNKSSQEVKSARTCFDIYVSTIFNYTLDTSEVVFMVEEEVMRVERTLPSLSHFAT